MGNLAGDGWGLRNRDPLPHETEPCLSFWGILLKLPDVERKRKIEPHSML